MNDTEKLEIDGILEKEGISSSDLERFFKSRRTSGELVDDELDAVSGGGCARSDSYTCPKCGQPLTWVSYYDKVEDSTRAYYLCYGCRKYGAKLDAGTLWPLPDNFVSWILDKAVKM